MKKVLFAALAALTIVACVKNSDYDADQERLAIINASQAQRIAELQDQINDLTASDEDLMGQVTALTTTVNANDAATTATLDSIATALEADADALAALDVVVAGLSNYDDEDIKDRIDDLEDEVDDIADDLEDLEEDVDDLQDSHRGLDATLNNVVWTPLFTTQTASFVQTGASLTGTPTRTINIGTTSNTITVNTFEHAVTPIVDVNTDRDHADAIRATRVDYTYTGTVSGTTTVVGSHTVTGTLSSWIVVNNN